MLNNGQHHNYHCVEGFPATLLGTTVYTKVINDKIKHVLIKYQAHIREQSAVFTGEYCSLSAICAVYFQIILSLFGMSVFVIMFSKSESKSLRNY